MRQALDYVARGEVDAGFVYTTDAAIRAGRVKEAFRPPEDTYRPVTYPAAVVAGSKQAALAQAFIDLLAAAKAGRAGPLRLPATAAGRDRRWQAPTLPSGSRAWHAAGSTSI